MSKVTFMDDYKREDFIKKGNKAIYENDIDKALKIFEEANEKFPNESSIVYNLASIYIEKGKIEESENLLKGILQYDPNHLYTLIGLANIVYYRTEDLKKATLYLKIALKANPESHEVYTSYGNLNLIHGNPKNAVEYFQKSLKIKPDNEIAEHGLSNAYNCSGMALVKERKFEKALFCFNQAVRYNEEWLSPKLNIARVFGFIKKYKKAIEIISEIKNEFGNIPLRNINQSDFDRDFIKFYLNVNFIEAKILYEQNEVEKTYDILKKIYEIDDKILTLNYYLAILELEKNNIKVAKKHIEAESDNMIPSVRIKVLKYIIYNKLKEKVSSWDKVYMKMIEQTNPNTYNLFDSALMLEKYGFKEESQDLFRYSKRLNNKIFEELLSKKDDSSPFIINFGKGDLL